MLESNSYTSFNGHSLIASGSLLQNALAAKRAIAAQTEMPILIFDNATGRTIDLDLRGTDEEIASRLPMANAVDKQNPQPTALHDLNDNAIQEPRGRGRPKLGVIAREVTLLPRHWDWLATQPGGASIALRKLVEDARRNSAEKDKLRAMQERAYHFMMVMAGDLTGFEEASRALFANDEKKLKKIIQDWPTDVRDHVIRLALDSEPS